MTEPFALPGLKNQAEIAILPYVLYNYVIPAKNTIRGENTMNKTELIAVMAETSGLSKKTVTLLWPRLSPRSRLL